MAGEIAEAFVRVRPNATAFGNELQGQTKRGISKLTKTLGAVGLGVGLIDQFKKTAQAAAEEESRAILLSKALDNVGAAHVVAGKSVEDLIDKETRLKGFTDSELSQSLTRLITATGDTAKSWKDLGLAEDLARNRKISLSQAALILSKAEQGQTTALRRAGIIIPPVTTATDKLKKAREQLAVSGGTLTKAQAVLYKQHLANAAAADKEASRQKVLAEVQRRFGGFAASFADTTQGALARASVGLNEFREAVGGAFLPVIASGAAGLATWIGNLQKSGDAQHVAAGIVHDLGDAYHFVRTALDGILTVAGPVAGALHDIVGAVGIGPLLAGFAAYKAIGIGLSIATAAKARWAAITGTAAAAEAVEGEAAGAAAGALAANTAAVIANTLALEANAVGAGTAAAAQSAFGLQAELLAAKIAATDTAIVGLGAGQKTATTAAAGLRGGLAKLVLGPAGITALGVAAVIAEVKLVKLFNSALDKIATLDGRTTKLKAELDDVGSSGSMTGLINALSKAAGLEKEIAAANFKGADARKVQAGLGRAAAEQFAASVRGSNAAFKEQVDLVADFAQIIQRVPTAKEIKFLVNAKDAKRQIGDLLAEIVKKTATVSRPGSSDLGNTIIASLTKQIASDNRAAAAAKQKAKEAGDAAGKEGKKAGEKAGTDTAAGFTSGLDSGLTKTKVFVETVTGRELGLPMIQGVIDGIQQGSPRLYDSLANSVGDAVKAARQSIIAEIQSARSNLNAIGGNLGSSLGEFIDKGLQNKIARLRHGLGSEITRLSNQIAKEQAAGQLAELRRTQAQELAEGKKGLDEARAQGARSIAEAQRQGGRSVRDAEQNLLKIQNAGPGADESGADFQARVKEAQQTLYDAADDANVAVENARREAAEQTAAAQKALDQSTHDNATQLQQLLEQQKLDALQKQFNAEVAQLEKRAALEKQHAQRRINDLTAEFNKGLLSEKKYVAEIQKLLDAEGANYRTVGGRLGLAYAEGFRAQVVGLGKQATAISQVPQVPGTTGSEINIVRPIDAVRAAIVSVEAAKQQRDQALFQETQAARHASERTAKATEKLAAKSDAAKKGDVFSGSLGAQTKGANR